MSESIFRPTFRRAKWIVAFLCRRHWFARRSRNLLQPPNNLSISYGKSNKTNNANPTGRFRGTFSTYPRIWQITGDLYMSNNMPLLLHDCWIILSLLGTLGIHLSRQIAIKTFLNDECITWLFFFTFRLNPNLLKLSMYPMRSTRIRISLAKHFSGWFLNHLFFFDFFVNF